MMRVFSLILILALLVCAMTGCVNGGGGDDDDQSVSPEDQEVMVEVHDDFCAQFPQADSCRGK
jgi:hypothetical protein